MRDQFLEVAQLLPPPGSHSDRLSPEAHGQTLWSGLSLVCGTAQQGVRPPEGPEFQGTSQFSRVASPRVLQGRVHLFLLETFWRGRGSRGCKAGSWAQLGLGWPEWEQLVWAGGLKAPRGEIVSPAGSWEPYCCPPAMWPFLSSSLFPPPSEDWLQRASSDPKAQGWGAWTRAEENPVGPSGARGEEEEEEEGAADVLLSLWEGQNPAECPASAQVACRGGSRGPQPACRGGDSLLTHVRVPQDLEAVRRMRRAMERAVEAGPQGFAGNEEGTGVLGTGKSPARGPPALSPFDPYGVPGSQERGSPAAFPAGWPCPRSPTEVAADYRSVYVGNVSEGNGWGGGLCPWPGADSSGAQETQAGGRLCGSPQH